MKKAMIVVSFLILLGLLAYQTLIAWDVRNVRDSGRSFGYFMRDAAARNCLTKETLIQLAVERNWDYEDARQPVYRSFAPDEYAETLRVFMEPQLNFVKEPGVRFFFDSNGCLIDE